MLNPELLNTGLITMIIGMGIVFSFLVILVFAISIMTKCVDFINKVCPLPVEDVKTSKKNRQIGSDESEIALAIALAKVQ